MSYMFNECYSLTSLELSNFNTINTEDINYIFRQYSSLSSLNLSNFNTINVKDMNEIFLNLDIKCILQTKDKKLFNK